MSTEQKPKGWGYTYVSAALWPHLGSPETPDAWHKALLLPDTLEIERVERNYDAPHSGDLFRLRVVSDAIPVSDIETEVRLYHRKDGDKAIFGHIELAQWNGTKWREVNCNE